MRTEGDVGQCDLDLGSSHYIRADTGLPHTHTDYYDVSTPTSLTCLMQ